MAAYFNMAATTNAVADERVKVRVVNDKLGYRLSMMAWCRARCACNFTAWPQLRARVPGGKETILFRLFFLNLTLIWETQGIGVIPTNNMH